MPWTQNRVREQRTHRKRLRHTLRRREKARARRRHKGLLTSFHARDIPLGLPAPRRDYSLTFPPEMNFSTHIAETARFFSEFRHLVNRVKPRLITIDHSALQRISPAAALVLIAEIFRGAELLRHTRFRGNLAPNADVHELLGEVGYWSYFTGIRYQSSKSCSRQYLQHRYSNRSSGKIVKEVIQHFSPLLRDPLHSKSLYPAIMECIDNVMKHAYELKDKQKPFYQRWWLLAYRDPGTHELSFCFYDQGLGIPRTIRVRFKDLLGPFSGSDSELIVKAVVEGHFSSTKDPTRGNGLPTLKRFIDTAKDGELTIVSHKSRCAFSPLATSGEREDFPDQQLQGTLIIWRLQN